MAVEWMSYGVDALGESRVSKRANKPAGYSPKPHTVAFRARFVLGKNSRATAFEVALYSGKKLHCDKRCQLADLPDSKDAVERLEL